MSLISNARPRVTIHHAVLWWPGSQLCPPPLRVTSHQMSPPLPGRFSPQTASSRTFADVSCLCDPGQRAGWNCLPFCGFSRHTGLISQNNSDAAQAFHGTSQYIYPLTEDAHVHGPPREGRHWCCKTETRNSGEGKMRFSMNR